MFKTILDYLSKNKDCKIADLKKNQAISESILPHMLWLEKMGFIAKTLANDKYELITSNWNVTDRGRTYLEFLSSSLSKNNNASTDESILVYTCPTELKDSDIVKNGVVIIDVLQDLLSSAKKEVIISSPYIDENAINIIRQISNEVELKILTEEFSQPILSLQKTRPNTQIKKLRELSETGFQKYQVHAKFICVDSAYALVMSANLRSTSLYHNFEVGVMTRNSGIISSLKLIFQKIFSKLEPR